MSVNYKKFTCPICFHLPGKEIYQCKNGHIICDKCSVSLQQCPQCRVSLQGDMKGRNRALEEILDDLKIDCPFSNDGCRKKVGRSVLSDHRSSCNFGKKISLCKLIRYAECDFTVHCGNLNEAAHHIETVHGRPTFTASEDGKVSIELPYILNAYKQRRDFIWKRIIQFEKERGEVLFVAFNENNFLSWIFLDFSEAVKGRRTMAKISSKETPLMSWELPVYHVMEAEERLSNAASKTHLPSLMEQWQQVATTALSDESKYVVNIKITDID